MWTSGRYHAPTRSALLINLLNNEGHMYEDDSAEVVGEMLKTPRGGWFDPEAVADATGTYMEDLQPFLDKMVEQRLLTDTPPTDEMLAGLRKQNRDQRMGKLRMADKEENTVKEMLKEYHKRTRLVTNVMFELTYRCSEQCLHCYNPGATRNNEERSGRGDHEELTLGDWKRIIDELADMGVCMVALTGGDPFSNRYAWDIIDYLHQKDMPFEILTNGQRLVGQTERLASYFPMVVSVSLYSGVAEEHDYITRVKGSWQRSVDVLRELSEMGVLTNIKSTIMRPALKGYRKLPDVAAECGAMLGISTHVNIALDGDTCPVTSLRMQPEEMEVLMCDPHNALFVDKDKPLEDKPKDEPKEKPKKKAAGLCSGGSSGFNVTPEGDLTPCCMFHAVLGNLKKQSMREIISQSKPLQYIRSLAMEDEEDCRKHDYCKYCAFCPGMNFMENGSPLKPSLSQCEVAKQRYALAQKMHNEGYDPLHGKTVDERIAEFPDYRPEMLHRMPSNDFRDQELSATE